MSPQEKPFPTPKIFPALAAVMQEMAAISKDGQNKQQNFAFRGIDQVYNALHPLMAKYEVITVPRVIDMRTSNFLTKNGTAMVRVISKVAYDFVCCVDGSHITVGPVTGEGMDSGDKACNKALAIAHKYAMLQTFMIPTEKTDDPDFESPQIGGPEQDVWGQPPAAGPDPFDGWDQPVNPPAASTPAQPPNDGWGQPQQQAAPQQNAPVFDVLHGDTGEVERLKITTYDEAADLADLIISLAEKAPSFEHLRDFWQKNLQPLDFLDQHFNPEFERIKTAFADISKKLGAKA